MWTISEFVKKLKPNLYSLHSNEYRSDYYVVAGYRFKLGHYSDAHNFIIEFDPRSGVNYDLLEWPFKAIFITRVVCHRDIKNSLIFKSPLIVISKEQYMSFWSHIYRWGHIIASIPFFFFLSWRLQFEFSTIFSLVTNIICFLNASSLHIYLYFLFLTYFHLYSSYDII